LSYGLRGVYWGFIFLVEIYVRRRGRGWRVIVNLDLDRVKQWILKKNRW